MTNRSSNSLLRLGLAIVVCGVALGWAENAQAQQVVYIGSGTTVYHAPLLVQPSIVVQPPVVLQPPVLYQRVYQGQSWHRTPTGGWYTLDHFIDVPQVPAGVYAYPAVRSVPSLTLVSHD